MAEISYRRHRFPPAIIQHAVWLYLRSNLSYRDVEELLAERGLDISYATVRGQTRLPRYPRASRARFGQHRDPTQHEVRCLQALARARERADRGTGHRQHALPEQRVVQHP